jgi:pimeloyl-ACP methyl ester carboxylesterase
MRILGRILLGLVVLIVVSAGAAAWVYRDIPAEVLEAKYAGPTSQFIEIDGVRLHYRDEGEGPVVVLMHAHWASLIMWDSWADALKSDYRVLRYDMPSHGLTGPDPSGIYTMERNIELAEKFLDAMGVDGPIYLGGTSMGGTTSIRYTGKHPDLVERLIILNPGALNATVRGRDTPPELPWFIDAATYITLPKYRKNSSPGGTTCSCARGSARLN